MNEAFDKALIEELEEFLAAAGVDARAEELNGADTIVIEYDGDYAPEDCTIAVTHPDDDTTAVYMLFSLVSELDDETVDELVKLVPSLNSLLSVGGFGVSRENGYFWFSHSLIVDEELDRRTIFAMIAATLEICAATAAEGIMNAVPVLNGEKTAAELINDENGEDTAIIQF